MKKEQSSDSDQVYNEQDNDYQEQSRLQQSFIEQCDQIKQKNQITKPLFNMNIPKSIELMFILFSFYKQDITSIGIDFNCKVKISLDKIKISSQNALKDVQACNAEILKYLQKISYTQLDHQNKQKIQNSPYFKQKAQQNGFRMCKFNQIVYCHSNKKTEKDLKTAMKQLFSGQYLFTVDIKYRKAKDKQIYKYLRDFIKKMNVYQSQKYKQRQIVVQIDRTETKVNCIGDKQRNLVAVKNMVRNMLQSTVILIIKFENQQQIDGKVQALKKYAEKITNFPYCIAKIQKRAFTIISKQNIINKFLLKQKVLQILKLNDKAQLGMFIPRRCNYRPRKMMVQQICTKKGYDFTTLGGNYHYFKKMFIHEGQIVDPKQVLQLIKEVLQAIKQNKQRLHIPQKIRDRPKKQIDQQVMQGQYYSAEQRSHDIAASKMLKRNVLRQKLKMSKPARVKYNIIDSPESGITYWYINDQQKKIQCKIQEMVIGTQYFCGKTKNTQTGKLYWYQYKLIVI